MIRPIELVFKEVDGLKICMDVYIPETATADNPIPILFWWHGGGLLQGTRKGEVHTPKKGTKNDSPRDQTKAVSPHMLAAPENHNLCLISADYRLAPQTRMPGILSDCKDALDFLRTSQFAEKTGSRVDPSRIVLSGSSAGGWLSLLLGTGIGFEECGLQKPAPVKGIAALYAITDLVDPFWKVVKRPVSYMERIIADEEVQPFINPDDIKSCFSALEDRRAIFYHYMVQEAILSSLLLDGTRIPEQTFSVAQALKSGTFSPPPAYIVTGNNDGKVPHVQSLDVVAALHRIGGKVEYDELEGLDHGFDREEGYEMENMYKFVKEILESKQ